MAYKDKIRNPDLRSIHMCLDSLTPVNAVQATGTLTFSDAVSDGETVTIGTDTYEFDTDESVTEGNILVDVSGGATASDAVTALVSAITASGDGTYSGADGAGDTVVITYGTYGTTGNSVATTETCANGAWGATTLESGVNGTPGRKGQMYHDADYIWVCQTEDMTTTNHYWEYASLT
jgi:hypothetical protein